MEENKNYLNRYLIWTAVIAAFILLYVLTNVPEIVGRKNRELVASREIAVTIPEGFNVGQIGETFEKLGIFSKNVFVSAAQSQEGYLFPDTYRFYKDAKPEDVIKKMRDHFDKKITPEILDQIKLKHKTLRDIIIMASILEEEVKSAEDRKIVAGILWKRLDLDMALNVDSALTYIFGKASAELTESDLKIDSRYNTYRYRALPPTPLSNPGTDAVSAAMNPTKTKYFYYLTGKDGKTYYAATLDGH